MHSLKRNLLTKDTVLIIGAGHVGEACAIKFIKHGAQRVILHTLTETEADTVYERVFPFASEKTDLIKSWGNILYPEKLAKKIGKELDTRLTKVEVSELLNFCYSPSTPELQETAFLYTLIEKHKPSVIIDTVNTATVVGYQNDPYTLARELLTKSDTDSVESLLLSNPIPLLIRFVQSLQHSIKKFDIDSYIKVSTTGLGGMGMNIPYTHGDLNELGMSSGILGKVAAAGIMHQLFWSLSHTPGCNIKVIIPSALIGWQEVAHGSFRSHGDKLYEVVPPNPQIITIGSGLMTQVAEMTNAPLEIPYVDSGENNAYSLHEMMAITALGQMESVTREEVAEAVIQSALGSTSFDILTALDKVTLNPSYTAAIQRNHIFKQMRKLEENSKYPSIATNNLGPTVSKHLFELHILVSAGDCSIKNLLDASPQEINMSISEYLKNNKEIINYALALGLPIIKNDGTIMILNNSLVPKDKSELDCLSEESIDKHASDGWIDLREKTIRNWIHDLRQLEKEKEEISSRLCIPLERNWQNIEESNVGEILGYIYSMKGGNRKKELTPTHNWN